VGIPVIRALDLLKEREVRREGERVALAPPLMPEELKELRPLKPGLLAALEDGEEVAGAELFTPPRLALVLAALFPPPPGPLEVAASGRRFTLPVFPSGSSPPEELRAVLLSVFPSGSSGAKEAGRVWVGGHRWTLDVEAPTEALLVARTPELGLEIYALPRGAALAYLRACEESRLPPEEVWLEVDGATYRARSWSVRGARRGGPSARKPALSAK